MRKWLKLGLIMLFLGLNIMTVDAQTVSIICPKSVKPGNKFSCTINASHDSEYGGIDANLSYSSGLTYNGFSRSFSNGEIYNNKLSVYDVDLKKGTSKVGTITFTLNKNTNDSQTIRLTNILMYDADSLGMNVKDVSTTVKVDTSVKKSSSASSGKGGNASSGSGSGTASTSSKIKALVIANGEINFKKDITEYEITVGNEVTELELDISLEDGNGKYTIKGNKDFKEGENLVEIEVISKKGKKTIYKIKVIRLSKSNDSLLKSLVVKNYDIKFKESKFKYTIYVDDECSELDIEAVTKDEQAIVVIGGNKNLTTGDQVSVVVQAEDGTTSMYEILIIEKITLLYLGLGGGIFLIIFIILMVCIFKKKKKKQQIFMDLKA